METASITQPGHGWTTSKKRLVTLDENGRFITKSDTSEGFSGSFPSDFVRDHCEKKGICFPYTNREFGSTIIEVLRSYFATHNIADEFDELLQTGRSNGREMKWDIMTISPNTSFKLHAHPNIEIIYVIDGAIHELRYEGLLTKKYTSITDMCGPNLSEGCTGSFDYRSTRAKAASDTSTEHTNFLVNEKGSVHQSFSREDGALLLILWSGCHADVPKEFFPPKGMLPDLPLEVLPMQSKEEVEIEVEKEVAKDSLVFK